MKDLQSLLFILNLSAIMAFPRLGLSKSSLDLSLPPEIINELTQKEIRRVTPSSSTSVVMRSHPANIAHDLSNETDENSPLIQIEISDQTCVYTTLKDEALLKAFCDEYRLNPIQDNFIYIPNLNALHPEEYEKVIAELFPLKKHTLHRENIFYMQGLAVMFLAAFSQLPNRITNWEDNENDLNAIEQWRESVKSGPHFDNDIWYINYVAHPTVGSWYYSLARINGMSPSASFAYAVFLSTMWEYTTEATKERPSIQDLIITPVIGSLLGEVSYRLIKKIENNNNRVWGSKLIGKTIKTLLNPTIPATRFVKKTLGKFVKVGDVKLQVFYRVITESSTFNFKKKSNNSPALGVRMTVDFNL